MLYEYECKNCGNIQEEIHGMNENPEIKCSKCQTIMQRIITGGTGIIFKGGGWTTSDSKFSQSMKSKSEKAKKKMYDHNQPITKMSDLKQ